MYLIIKRDEIVSMKFLYYLCKDLSLNEEIEFKDTKISLNKSLQEDLGSKEIFFKGDLEDTELWKLSKVPNNFIFGFSKDFILNNIDTLKKYSIQYFCLSKANSYKDLNFQNEKLNCSIIFLDNELCFDLKRVSKYCHNNSIKTMVSLNDYEHCKGVVNFFVRPEDVLFYSDYIDYGVVITNKTNHSLIQNAYRERKFKDNLQFIIHNMPFVCDNNNLYMDFPLSRIDCRQRCLLEQCALCNRYIDFSNKMKEKELNLIFK